MINEFSWLTVDLQMLLMCRLKFSVSSNSKPRSSADDTNLICWLSTVIRSGEWSLFYLFNIISWNLSVFTTILFFLNQSITTTDSDSNILINIETVVANAGRVLSSAKLVKRC